MKFQLTLVCYSLAILLAVPLSVRAETEVELIRLLQSSVGVVQKAEACKQLRLCGTARAVPALALLLDNEQLSQVARYALEGITAPEAAKTLREALSRTSGRLQAGVADSLGWKGDSSLVPLLVPLLRAADPDVACAAVGALGRLGGREAVAALDAARGIAPPAVRPAVLEALLNRADSLLAAGELDRARRIYESLFLPGESFAVREAAYAGRIRAAGENALALIQAGIEDSDGAAQVAALHLAGTVTHPDATRAFAGLLPKSSAAVQIALLAILQARGDASVMSAVLEQARNPNAAVRIAALGALGAIGDATVVPALTKAVASRDPAEQRAAREALAGMNQPGVSAEIVEQMRRSTPAVQMELARALAARGDRNVLPSLFELATSQDAGTRQAAFLALTGLVNGSDTPALVRLLSAAKGAEGKDEVRRVFEPLAGIPGGLQPLEVEPLVQGFASGDLETREALLPLFALFTNEALRAPFRAALQDGDERIRTAAARALCDAQDPALLPDLLTVAGQTQGPRLRTLALDGVVRLATDESFGMSTPQRVSTLATAFEIAARVEEKRRVVSGLARVPDPLTLQLAERAATNAAVRVEAELACLQIAQKLGMDHTEAAKTVLTRLATNASSAEVRKEAGSCLQKLNEKKRPD